MGDGTNKHKLLIIGISTFLLVAMVMAVIIGTMNTETDNYKNHNVSDSRKTMEIICAPTDYKDVCFDTLKSTAETTDDPKDLIEASFRSTIEYLEYAVKNSTLLQVLEKDPRTKLALENCQELAKMAMNDLEKTYTKFRDFDITNMNQMFTDLQIWISGAVTYEETCLDGFEDEKGDAGDRMRHALKTAMELTSNALAMVTDISSVFSSLDTSPDDILTPTTKTPNRRLLSANDFPGWLPTHNRKLLDLSLSSIKPDLIVAKDGSEKFQTINEALKEIPKNSDRTFILYIKEGIYQEKVQFNTSLTHVMVIGDGPTKTRITGSLNFIDGTPTYHTATVAVLGDYFIAKDIGFENAAGAAKHQAVALRVGADKSVFYNCHMDGYQDTLYAHTYRQFYRNCEISGTIDFVFGDAAAVFQNCTFKVRKPLENQQCIVSAQGRKEVRQPTGLVFQNCSFISDPEYYTSRTLLKSYLGRPWKEFSRTIIMESFIDDLIQPQGWLPWNETFALNTLFYTEFNNRGPGSGKQDRIKWNGVKELPVHRILRFTAAKFIDGQSWLPSSGVPFYPGLIFPPPPKDEHVKYSPPSVQEVRDLGRKKERESYVNKPGKNNSTVDSELLLPPSPAPVPESGSIGDSNPNINPIASPSPKSSFQHMAPDSGSPPVGYNSPAPAQARSLGSVVGDANQNITFLIASSPSPTLSVQYKEQPGFAPVPSLPAMAPPVPYNSPSTAPTRSLGSVVGDSNQNIASSPSPTSSVQYKAQPGSAPVPSLSAMAPPVPSLPVMTPPVPSLPAMVPPVSSLRAMVPPVPSFSAMVPPFPSLPAMVPPVPSLQAMDPPLPSLPAMAPPLPSLPAMVPPVPSLSAVTPPVSSLPVMAPPVPYNSPSPDQDLAPAPISSFN